MDKVDHPAMPKFPPPPQPVFEVKVNDNILGQRAPQPQPIYPATYVPVPNPLHPSTLYNPPAIGYAWTPNNVPVIKNYNISVNNATGDLSQIAQIYEDVLPPTAIAQNRYTTLSERLVINNYVRSMIITKGDNEEIHMDGDNKRKTFELSNLMSRLKFMDINPYHFSRLTNNVYRTIPKNMVMFRTCYPVRFNQSRIQVQCASDSISMHVRIYSLSLFDKFVTAGVSDKLKKTYSDVWREILYYEKIKEDVIKKKVCPNFVTMYAYFRTQNSGVNFQKIEELSSKYKNYNFDLIKDVNKVKDEMFHQEVIAKTQEIAKDLFVVWGYGRMPSKETNEQFQNKDQTKKFLLDDRMDKSKVKSEQCIVAVTEGPTQNILNWATKTYQVNGPIHKQIQSGVYDDKVWKSIIFQLVVAMMVLEQQKIAFRDFSLENNVYIKDLNAEANSTSNIGYWKYRVNNIDYYVPNYGYLLMIDSRFPEFNMDEDDTVSLSFDPDHISQLLHYKIYGEMYEDKHMDINKGNIDSLKAREKMILSRTQTEVGTAKGAHDGAKRAYDVNKKAYDVAKAAYDAAVSTLPPGTDPLTNATIANERTIYDRAKATLATSENAMSRARANYEQAYDKLSKKVVVNKKYEDMIQENQKKVFDPTAFNKAFQLYGGVPPPSKINDLMASIHGYLTNTAQPSLKQVLLNNFNDYIHNKVGDLLLEEEKMTLMPHDKNFVSGEVVAYETSPDNYEWAIYMDANNIMRRIRPAGRQIGTPMVMTPITHDQISRVYGTVKQKFNTTQKLSDDDLLDTYTIY
jgi:hypothetical protein